MTVGDYSGTYGIIGPPGTGKTTFLAAQVRRIVEASPDVAGRTPVLVSSLTKAAAAEIGGRDLPLPAAAVGTLHAHAFRALGHPTIVTGEVLADFNARHHEFSIAGDDRPRPNRSNDDLEGDVVEIDPGGDAPGDKYLQTYDLLRAMRIDQDRWSYAGPTAPVLGRRDVIVRDLERFVDAYEDFKTAVDAYDFTDLIGGAVAMEPPMNPDVLVVDEVQDLSALEWELVRVWSEGRTLFAVGDPWQALYTWRGAHPELFDAIPQDRLRVLSRSYRVPRTIVDAAMRWMVGKSNTTKAIEYRPRIGGDGNEVDGSIGFDLATTPGNVAGLIDRVEESIRAGRTAMIQATCSYMLGDVLTALRDRGIPYANPWRAKRGDWNPLSVRGTSTAERFAAFLVPAFERRYWTWSELATWIPLVRVDGTLRPKAKTLVDAKAKERMADEPATSLELSTVFGDSSVYALVDAMRNADDVRTAARIGQDWLVRRLLSKTAGRGIEYAARVLGTWGAGAITDRPRVYVGTCHSFKGAEADDVFLFTELSGAAIDGLRNHDAAKDHVDAIGRTFYVGMTRARENLTILGTSHKIDESVYPVGKHIRTATFGVA